MAGSLSNIFHTPTYIHLFTRYANNVRLAGLLKSNPVNTTERSPPHGHPIPLRLVLTPSY